jgi:hypothetical protein
LRLWDENFGEVEGGDHGDGWLDTTVDYSEAQHLGEAGIERVVLQLATERRDFLRRVQSSKVVEQFLGFNEI